jgi:hypothetical protein
VGFEGEKEDGKIRVNTNDMDLFDAFIGLFKR